MSPKAVNNDISNKYEVKIFKKALLADQLKYNKNSRMKKVTHINIILFDFLYFVEYKIWKVFI